MSLEETLSNITLAKEEEDEEHGPRCLTLLGSWALCSYLPTLVRIFDSSNYLNRVLKDLSVDCFRYPRKAITGLLTVVDAVVTSSAIHASQLPQPFSEQDYERMRDWAEDYTRTRVPVLVDNYHNLLAVLLSEPCTPRINYSLLSITIDAVYVGCFDLLEAASHARQPEEDYMNDLELALYEAMTLRMSGTFANCSLRPYEVEEIERVYGSLFGLSEEAVEELLSAESN